MAMQLGNTTLVNLAKFIVDKLESLSSGTTFGLSIKEENLLLDYKKAIAEKDKDTLVYLLTKI